MIVDRHRPSAGGPLRHLAKCLAATTVAVGLVVAASATPAGAVTVGGPTPFGVTPTPLANGEARPYFKLTLAPGHSTTDTVTITNHAKSTQTLKIGSSIGVTAPNSGSAFSGFFHACAGTACWVKHLPATVTLAPGHHRALRFTVDVPAGTPSKQYLAGITAEPKARPRPVTGHNRHSSAQAVIVDQISVGVAVTVGPLSRMSAHLQIPTVTGGADGPVPRVLIHLHNTGQTFNGAKGAVSCVVHGKRRSLQVTADTVLPDTTAVLPINAKPIALGATVPCTVRLVYGPRLIAAWSGNISTPAATATKVIRTGKGTYSNLPIHKGIPTWAIVLIAIGVLILAALTGLILVLLRRRSHLPKPAITTP